MKRKHATVSIPVSLFKKIENRIERTGFASVSEYVTYVLEEVLTDSEEKKKNIFTEEEEERVKQRLKALGYLE
jgi:Arc/MetJ-type ribon-helix-helix transcriptional regulator